VDKGTEQQLASIADYQRTFSSKHGKKVLRHLMRNCGIMMPSMDLNNPSELGLAFNEGRRSVAIEILEKIRADLVKIEKEILSQPEEDSDVII